MKSYNRNLIRNALRGLGFSRVKGKASGHETWQDQNGKCCRPVLRKRDVSLATIYSLGQELQNKGVISRRKFIEELTTISRR